MIPVPQGLLPPRETALLVIDVQERFRAAIPDFPALAAACARLVRTFRILELPITITEQYPKGLGKTVPEILEALEGAAAPAAGGKIPEKTAFSAFRCAGIPERLREAGVRTVLACGIEGHVCVSQTVHDLLAAGYAVHAAVDAIGSRRPSDREAALRKMERSGAVLTTSEMAAFELLADAKHPKFKEVQALYK